MALAFFPRRRARDRAGCHDDLLSDRLAGTGTLVNRRTTRLDQWRTGEGASRQAATAEDCETPDPSRRGPARVGLFLYSQRQLGIHFVAAENCSAPFRSGYVESIADQRIAVSHRDSGIA